MQEERVEQTPNRRRILGLGTVLAGGLLAAQTVKAQPDDNHDKGDGGGSTQPTPRQVELAHQIEQIIGAQGTFSDGVFSIEVDRNDITNVTIHGIPIKPAFQVNGTLVFEFRDDGQTLMNSDLALKGSEINPFIDALIAHDVIFQAEHQHFYDFDPIVWFIHFRKFGDALEIAHGVKAALNKTSTPFPQTSPSNPKTPLPAEELGEILGATPQIGADGIVNFSIPRANPISLAGVRINPFLNIETPVSFEPLGGGKAAGVIDFGMISSEIMNVVSVMRKKGWDIGCLYNQETAEEPQLYFSHQFKTGDPIALAKEMRAGLEQMNVKLK